MAFFSPWKKWWIWIKQTGSHPVTEKAKLLRSKTNRWWLFFAGKPTIDSQAWDSTNHRWAHLTNSQDTAPPINFATHFLSLREFKFFLWRIFLRNLLPRQTACLSTPINLLVLFSVWHSVRYPRQPLTRCNSYRGRQRGIHFHRVHDLQDRDAAIGQADGHHGRTSGVPLQVIDHCCATRVLS